jgi:hypothetical protein
MVLPKLQENIALKCFIVFDNTCLRTIIPADTYHREEERRVIILPVNLLTAAVHPQSPGGLDPIVLGNLRLLLYSLL